MCRLICNLPELRFSLFSFRSSLKMLMYRRSACFHIFLTLVVRVVKVVIGVKVKCLVDFFNVLRAIITNKTNVPADLRSAGI